MSVAEVRARKNDDDAVGAIDSGRHFVRDPLPGGELRTLLVNDAGAVEHWNQHAVDPRAIGEVVKYEHARQQFSQFVENRTRVVGTRQVDGHLRFGWSELTRRTKYRDQSSRESAFVLDH